MHHDFTTHPATPVIAPSPLAAAVRAEFAPIVEQAPAPVARLTHHDGAAPDLEAAARFLALLDEGEDSFEFRTFDDSEAKRPTLARKLSGSLDDVAPELARLNRAGAGVFVVINRGGQNDDEITRVRAVFADTDGAPLDPIMTCGMHPNLTVESSPGNYHAYWLVDGLEVAEFKPTQQAIVAKFGTDRSVCNPSRVLRLPGFMHRKGEAFRVHVIDESGGQPYSAERILRAFPPLVAADVTERAPTAPTAPHDGSGVVVAEDRHGDLLKFTGGLARMVHFGGMARDSALAAIDAEYQRGRWTRTMSTEERRAALDDALAKCAAGEWKPTLTQAGEAVASRFAEFDVPATRPTAATDEGDTRAGPTLRVVEVGTLTSATVAESVFAVETLIPAAHPTLLGAHGGAGKSTLAVVLAGHKACGKSWAGFDMHAGRVVVLSLEDPGELVRYRLQQAAETYGLDKDLLAGNLTILDGTEGDSALAVEVSKFGTRTLEQTRVFFELEAAARGAALVIVDNASDAFDASDIERRYVRKFMRGMLGKIARDNNAGVLLLAHIDKAAARFGSAGNSYSGSTAWHNSARSRLALVEHEGVLELRHEKSNLCRKAEPVRLSFTDAGVLVPAAHSAARVVDFTQDSDAMLLACLAGAIGRGETITTARSGPGNALSTARTLADFPAALRSSERFWSAMNRLVNAGSIVRETFTNASRKEREKWAIAPVAPVAPVLDK